MASQKKSLLWVKAQGMRWVALVKKTFPHDFLYTAAKKLYYRKKTIDKNRRFVGVGRRSPFLHYLRCLRDGFPDDERFRFAWGGFQASSSPSSLVFSDLLKKKHLLFTMENPILGRHRFDNTKTRDKGYFRVALYESAVFDRGIFNLPHKADASRFNDILKATNSTIKPYRTKGEHIIYALQVPYDRSLVGLDMFVAAQYDLIALRMRTSRKILVTVNPAMIRELWAAKRLKDRVAKSYKYLKNLCRSLDIEVYDKFKEAGKNSSQFLKNCWCVVCHSSGFAVDAVLAGVPAITLHRGNFVYPICSHDLSEVENPKMPDRIPWFSRLAYCQWTLEEIKNGDAWRHFQPSVERWLEKK